MHKKNILIQSIPFTKFFFFMKMVFREHTQNIYDSGPKKRLQLAVYEK